MELPKHSCSFASPYLQQFPSHLFDQFYIGPRTCFLELLGMAISSLLPDSPEALSPLWEEYKVALQWTAFVKGKLDQYSAWDGLKTEIASLLDHIGVVDWTAWDLDNEQLFEAIVWRFGVSIVWFEEVGEGVRTRLYRHPDPNYLSPLIYLGSDLQQQIYAFHPLHPQTSNPTDLFPPIIIGTPRLSLQPEALFLKIASLLVNTANAMPLGVYSQGISLQFAHYFANRIQTSSVLQSPLDPLSLQATLERFLGLLSAPTEPVNHSIAQCEQFPGLVPLISPHQDQEKGHYVHLSCFRAFVRRQRERNRQVRCPKCIKALDEELLEGFDLG